MTISLNNVGKRYNREWIFRRFSYTFQSGKSYAITGSNGSGKSTLLQVISGALTHNEGSAEFNQPQIYLPARQATDHKPQTIPAEQFYKYVSLAAPYLELIEEMTATEMLEFHQGFKELTTSIPEILKAVTLENAANKQIRYYSSGMKQRLKLAQAFFSNTPVLLLDEPTTNLDADGIALYHQLIKNHTANRLVIISSNDKQEYEFCEEVVRIGNYKGS